jgi:hypothetical protein
MEFQELRSMEQSVEPLTDNGAPSQKGLPLSLISEASDPLWQEPYPLSPTKEPLDTMPACLWGLPGLPFVALNIYQTFSTEQNTSYGTAFVYFSCYNEMPEAG